MNSPKSGIGGGGVMKVRSIDVYKALIADKNGRRPLQNIVNYNRH